MAKKGRGNCILSIYEGVDNMLIKNIIKSLPGLIALVFFLWFIIAGLIDFFTGKIEVDENVIQFHQVLNARMRIVDIDNDQNEILLFDNIFNNLAIYDSEGNLTKVYNFPSAAKIDIIQYESNGDLTIYQYRVDQYILVSSDGTVILSTPGINPTEGDYLELVKNRNTSNGDIEVSNNFFYYNLVINGESHFVTISLLPIVLFALSMFLISSRNGIQLLKKKNDDNF